jgi:hypothetical protein
MSLERGDRDLPPPGTPATELDENVLDLLRNVAARVAKPSAPCPAAPGARRPPFVGFEIPGRGARRSYRTLHSVQRTELAIGWVRRKSGTRALPSGCCRAGRSRSEPSKCPGRSARPSLPLRGRSDTTRSTCSFMANGFIAHGKRLHRGHCASRFLRGLGQEDRLPRVAVSMSRARARSNRTVP